MAQPDLVSQKIMGTDPQVGFGEASVLPYRERQLDTRGFEALERSGTRQQAREDARKKNNEDYFMATMKNLPDYRREVDETMSNKRNWIISKMQDNNARGINQTSDRELQMELGNYLQAASASKQLHDDFDKELSRPVSKYINRDSRNGALLKSLTEKYDKFNSSKGKASELSPQFDVRLSDHFNSDEFLNDKFSKTQLETNTVETPTSGPLGREFNKEKVSARFWIRDSEGNPIKPGVDQTHIDALLYTPSDDPDTLIMREKIENFTNDKIKKKALELKLSNDPLYKDMGVTEIEKRISSNPSDNFYKEFNKTKVKNEIAKKEIEKFQIVNRENTVRSGHKYPSDGSGGGAETNSPEGIFIKTLAGLQQQTPEFINRLDESEEVNENGVPYLDATSLFSGINTGQDSKGKASEPDAVFIDPEDQGTIYIRQNPGDALTPMNNAAVSQFAVQVGNIKGNNLNYKTMLQEGNKLGVFGANNQFRGENAATADPAFAKKQKALSKKVANEVVNRKTQLKSALESEKGSWITDFNRTKVDKVQEDINKNVLSNATLIAKDQTIKNPKVTIERGLLGGVTYVIKGSDDTEIKLTEDEFYSIAEGKSDSGRLVIGREAVKTKPATKAKKSISGF